MTPHHQNLITVKYENYKHTETLCSGISYMVYTLACKPYVNVKLSICMLRYKLQCLLAIRIYNNSTFLHKTVTFSQSSDHIANRGKKIEKYNSCVSYPRTEC